MKICRVAAALHHLARIHHHHIVTKLRDHAQMVRDEEDRTADLLLQILQQLDGGTSSVASSAVVGSSAISRAGSIISAMAIAMRCFMPPEN